MLPDLAILWACLSAAEPSATTACFDGELLAALLKAGWLTGNGVLQETSCPSCGRGGLSVFTEFPDSGKTEYVAYCGAWVFTLLTHPQWVVLGHG